MRVNPIGRKQVPSDDDRKDRQKKDGDRKQIAGKRDQEFQPSGHRNHFLTSPSDQVNVSQQIVVTTTTPIRFSASPARAIWRIVSRWLLNTMALGGVATGNMNAKLALMVAGTMINAGSICAVSAAAARIGSKSVAVAVLLVTSVVFSKTH